MGRGLRLASGRIIALGRLLLGCLFLFVLWLDRAQSAEFPAATTSLLLAYVAVAAGLVAAIWKSWWLDAQLSGPAHAVDIAMFTALVYLTEGDKSPFFTFFIFVLLAAAIRWGWRATALTALLLTLLYVVAGVLSVWSDAEFEVGRFVTRTGYLVIVSLILIWFGVNQWRARLDGPAERLLSDPSVDPRPIEHGLRAAIAAAGARSGAFLWSKRKASSATAFVLGEDHEEVGIIEGMGATLSTARPFLYDLANGRALVRDDERNLRAFDPADQIGDEAAAVLNLSEGLAVPVATGKGQGRIYLERIANLSTDHLELGEQIAAAIATHMQRQALMKAAEESAESRSRLAVARDLHDSVVQFLAGAAFRLEALKRSEASGRDLTPELNELKQLMLQEQGELRSFITALRSGTQMELADLATDLQALANRLSRQWDIQCTFSLQPHDMTVPTRLHLDAQQLVREAVANAVRHAGAKNVSIRLGGEADQVTLDFINDGATYPRTADGGRMPKSLRERAEAAGGVLELSRGMGVTKISISLPVAGKAA